MTMFYASYNATSDEWGYASKFSLKNPIYDPAGGDPGVSYANVSESGKKKTMFFYRTAKSFASLRWADGGWQEVAIPDNILKVTNYSSVGVYDDGLSRPELIAAASAVHGRQTQLSIVSDQLYQMPNNWNTGIYPGVSVEGSKLGPMVVAEDVAEAYFTKDDGIYYVREHEGRKRNFKIQPIYKYPFPRQKLCLLKNQDGRRELFFAVFGEGGSNNQIQHGWQLSPGANPPESKWSNIEPLANQYTNDSRVITGARNYLKHGKERLEVFYIGKSPGNRVYHCWQQVEGGWNRGALFANMDSKSVGVVLCGKLLLTVILGSDGQLYYCKQSPISGWEPIKEIYGGSVGSEASYVLVGLGPGGDPFVLAH